MRSRELSSWAILTWTAISLSVFQGNIVETSDNTGLCLKYNKLWHHFLINCTDKVISWKRPIMTFKEHDASVQLDVEIVTENTNRSIVLLQCPILLMKPHCIKNVADHVESCQQPLRDGQASKQAKQGSRHFHSNYYYYSASLSYVRLPSVTCTRRKRERDVDVCV